MSGVATRWLAALLAASCASGPTVEREILGRVQGVEIAGCNVVANLWLLER